MKKIILFIIQLISLQNFKEKILYKNNFLERYIITNKKKFKNSYQENLNLKIVKELIKKDISTYNSKLLLKYCNLTKKKN